MLDRWNHVRDAAEEMHDGFEAERASGLLEGRFSAAAADQDKVGARVLLPNEDECLQKIQVPFPWAEVGHHADDGVGGADVETLAEPV